LSNDKRFIREAFASIAPRYDLLNTLLSFGVERAWRRKTVAALSPGPGERILDLCAGTFTLSREVVRRSEGRALVIGVDFCLEMMELGLNRLDGSEKKNIHPACGDAELLPLKPCTFDAALVTYGIRNLEDAESCLAEVFRLLKPGGRFVILDFLRPGNPVIASLYRIYLRHFLPLIGGVISGSLKAYRHLSDSIGAFMEKERLLLLLEKSGFEYPGVKVLTLGIAGIFSAFKPVGA
jgi:demethylmenaquinone methyltransferase/2-methoxy-6-polyprenyl-1,4-benzoquinol methylase